MINIDPKRIKFYCTLPEHKFSNYYPMDDIGEYHYIDNHSDILGIGHLDSVFPHDKNFAAGNLGGYPAVISSSLDDRLGVYLLMDVLPSLGMSYDVLLTHHEESGKSSGVGFTPPTGKQYKWMFEIDRMGANECALYQYYTSNLVTMLKLYGFTGVNGSYTDITSMSHLQCVGFNFSAGYRNPHTLGCHAFLSDIKTIACKIYKFYAGNRDTEYPYKPVPVKTYPLTSYGGWDDLTGDNWNQYPYRTHGTYDGGYRYNPAPYIACDICKVRDSTVKYSRGYKLFLCDDCLIDMNLVRDNRNR